MFSLPLRFREHSKINTHTHLLLFPLKFIHCLLFILSINIIYILIYATNCSCSEATQFSNLHNIWRLTHSLIITMKLAIAMITVCLIIAAIIKTGCAYTHTSMWLASSFVTIYIAVTPLLWYRCDYVRSYFILRFYFALCLREFFGFTRKKQHWKFNWQTNGMLWNVRM